jgi:hypothetical protein
VRTFALALTLIGLAAPATASAGAVNLRFAYGDGAGHRKSATLTCDSAGPRATGYLRKRDPAKLCAVAYRLKRFLGSAPDKHRVCTQIYGGPQHVRVRGNVAEKSVNRRFRRTHGCQIADWKRARALLPHVA